MPRDLRAYYDFKETMLLDTLIVCALALAVLLVFATTRRSWRLSTGPQIAAVCVMTPALAVALLLASSPLPGFSLTASSLSIFGIEVPAPVVVAQEQLLWLICLYLLFSPLLGWCMNRVRLHPGAP